MHIKISKPFARNGKVDDFDTRQMKKALNRLGYYQPYEKTGITGTPDAGVFAGLKAFQKDHGLSATGAAKPGDETIKKLNDAASQTPEGQYIWRTAEDAHVRKTHAQFNRTIRNWSDDPDPGEDYNCRCWAEPIGQDMGLHQELIGEVNDSDKKWNAFDFAYHFAFGGGNPVTLQKIGYLADVISMAESVIFEKIEDQIANKMRETKSGPLIYRTSNWYDFSKVHWVLGKGVIETLTVGRVERNGNILNIDAEVTYTYYDEITDPFDLREAVSKHHRIYELPNTWYSGLALSMTDLYGSAYSVNDSWKTKLSGSISLDQ